MDFYVLDSTLHCKTNQIALGVTPMQEVENPCYMVPSLIKCIMARPNYIPASNRVAIV